MPQAKQKENYFIVDVLKLFFSFCIVALHTKLFANEFPTLHWYCSHIVFRIAVPFFFISSGYFFCKKVKNSKNPIIILKNTLKRLLPLFIFWLCITLPLEINTLAQQDFTISKIIIELLRKLLFYPWGALWYILALMVSYLLIYPFLVKKQYKLPLFIGFILFLFAIIGNSYYFVIENTSLQKIVDAYLKTFISTRNGLFLGFFYIAIANYLTVKKDYSRKKNVLILSLGIVGLILETIIIKNNHYVEDHSLFFSLILVAPALFEIARSYNFSIDGKKLRNLSVGIYVLHRPILGYLNYYWKLGKKIGSIQLFLIVLLIAITMSYILQKMNNKYINKIIT